MNKKYLPVFISILFLFIVFAFTSTPAKSIFKNNRIDTTAPVAIKAKDHLGKNVVSKIGAISFTTGLENDFYNTDSLTRVFHFYIEAKIAGFLNNAAKRIPLNISIVIDRSGSMQGIKMGYAKKAAKNIIDQLTPEDIISIVVYDNDVDTIQPPVNVIEKEKIKAKIDHITTQASTNLWGGAEQGYQFVKRNFKPNYVSRVLLISDGLANAGLTDSTLIQMKVQRYKDDEGISPSAFGVGPDYNETLMTGMAEAGAGNYYFIDAPEKMTAIFNNELNGLLNVAAQNAELKITLPKGITIQKGYPLKFQHTEEEVIIKLRDLSSQQTKAGLFTFKIDDKTNTVLKFTSTLGFTNVSGGNQKTLTNENILSPEKNAGIYRTHFNKQVIEQTVLYTANERLETAMNLMEKGDYEEAKKYLDENNAYLKANFMYATNRPLMQIDSINKTYRLQYWQAKAISADSVKKVQKANKAMNYRIRNKRQ